MRGHGLPSDIASGRRALSTVHGHPVLPAGGGGSSARVGQRIGSNESKAALRLAEKMGYLQFFAVTIRVADTTAASVAIFTEGIEQ
jgi:hypothetical protein